MDRSVIQNVMLERILSGKNKLSDFYDVFSYDIIADDVSKVLSDQKDHLFNISLLDIIIVGNFLVKEKKLTPSQISEFVLHINGEVGNGFKSPEYIDAIDELSSLLKCETNTLNKKIKAFKRRDKAAEELEHLANKRQQLIDAQEEKTIVMCRIKGTIDELQFIKKKLNVEVKHANKRDLLFKKHLKMAGLYEEQEKQIDPALKQLLDELNSYAVLIEAGELPLKELTLFIYKLDCLDIKDNSLKNAVKDILSELKSRLNQMDEESKKNKKHIKTLVKRELEIKNYRYIDLKEFGEIITLRNSLKANVSILEELKKQSTYSSANLKRQIRRDVIDAIGANINSATNGMQRIIDQKQFYDESIDGKEYIHGLSTYNEMQDLMLIRENELENYVTSNKVKEVFLLENAYGFARSDKYAFSIEEVGNEIKLGIHIQNIQPYLSEKMYTFLYNELFKKLSDDMLPNNYVNDVCSKYYTFKVNEVRPTIAYTLTFDKNFKFKSFDIESCDTILRKQTDEEVNILDGIYVNNDIPSYDRTDFFENLLLREFLKYVQKNNIPVMFYGKPVDDYNGKYNKTKKKCAEKMGDKLVKFSEAMGDVDRKTYDNICYKWYKNEKRYHFSLDIEESFRYYVKDLKILEPFSFQGYNLERLINLLVLNKNNLNQEQLDYLRGKLVEEQKRFIAAFNGASKYIDIDSFIDIVGKETGKVKSNKKR